MTLKLIIAVLKNYISIISGYSEFADMGWALHITWGAREVSRILARGEGAQAQFSDPKSLGAFAFSRKSEVCCRLMAHYRLVVEHGNDTLNLTLSTP